MKLRATHSARSRAAFTILEVVAVMLSVGVSTLLIQDGKTNWFEGLQLLAVWVILAMAFYFV